MNRVVLTSAAPAPVGPYSQGVAAGGLLWISMQLPLDPATGELVEGDVAAQARRVLTNLRAVVEAGGASLPQVARACLYLVDPADFAEVNRVMADFFPTAPPTRSAVFVTGLPRGARVAFDAVAVLS